MGGVVSAMQQQTTINHNFRRRASTTNLATMGENASYNFLLVLPCKLFFWEIAAQKWSGKKKGWVFLIPYADDEKTQIVFKPRVEETTTMWYCADVSEQLGGLRCMIHEAFAVGRHCNEPRAIVFGKAASRSYTNERKQPIKTAWMARFEEFWEANAFFFMLNRLREHNGRFRAFDDESQYGVIENFIANGEEEIETEEDNASDEEGSAGTEVIGVTEVIDLLSSDEELDDEESDVQTALRCRRMMTHPEGPSTYDDYGDDEEEEEEVAQSQNLFH
jgi:hypothetical protein